MRRFHSTFEKKAFEYEGNKIDVYCKYQENVKSLLIGNLFELKIRTDYILEIPELCYKALLFENSKTI